MPTPLAASAVRLLLWRACLLVGGALWCLLVAGSPSHADDGLLPGDPGSDDAGSLPVVEAATTVTTGSQPSPATPPPPPIAPQGAGTVVEKVTEAVRQVAPPAAQRVAEPVQQVAAPVLQPVTQIAEPAVEPVKKIVQPITQAAEQVLAPVTQIAEPAAQPVTRVVRSVVESSQADDGPLQPLGINPLQSDVTSPVATEAHVAEDLPSRAGSRAAAQHGAPSDQAGETSGPRPPRTTAASYAGPDARPLLIGGSGHSVKDSGREDRSVSTDREPLTPTTQTGHGSAGGVDRSAPVGGGAVLASRIPVSLDPATTARLSAATDRIPRQRAKDLEHTPD